MGAAKNNDVVKMCPTRCSLPREAIKQQNSRLRLNSDIAAILNALRVIQLILFWCSFILQKFYSAISFVTSACSNIWIRFLNCYSWQLFFSCLSSAPPPHIFILFIQVNSFLIFFIISFHFMVWFHFARWRNKWRRIDNYLRNMALL